MKKSVILLLIFLLVLPLIQSAQLKVTSKRPFLVDGKNSEKMSNL